MKYLILTSLLFFLILSCKKETPSQEAAGAQNVVQNPQNVEDTTVYSYDYNINDTVNLQELIKVLVGQWTIDSIIVPILSTDNIIGWDTVRNVSLTFYPCIVCDSFDFPFVPPGQSAFYGIKNGDGIYINQQGKIENFTWKIKYNPPHNIYNGRADVHISISQHSEIYRAVCLGINKICNGIHINSYCSRNLINFGHSGGTTQLKYIKQ